MNKLFKNFIIVLALLASIFLITNCKSDDDEGNPLAPTPGLDENLIGKWQLVEAYIPSMNLTVTAEDLGVSLIAEFKADGNFTMTSTDSTGVPEVETGTWTTANGTLTLKYSEDNSEENIQYTINGDIGILKSTYEVSPGNEIPADYKFKRI